MEYLLSQRTIWEYYLAKNIQIKYIISLIWLLDLTLQSTTSLITKTKEGGPKEFTTCSFSRANKQNGKDIIVAFDVQMNYNRSVKFDLI